MASRASIQILREFGLPTVASNENAVADLLCTFLGSIGISEDDGASWVQYQKEMWQETGVPKSELKAAARIVIGAFGSSDSAGLAEIYFELHRQLRTDLLFSHARATAFLVNFFLIGALVRDHQLSAAQVSKILSSREPGGGFSRQAVAMTLRVMGSAPSLNSDQVAETFRADALLELVDLADSNLVDAADTVEKAARRVGFDGPISRWLQALAPADDLARFSPYLQMLHYQCTILEYFDHPVTDLYEFTPRGQAVNWLLAQYPTNMRGAGNPFLNNAKAVEQLDAQWVRSKRGASPPGASALLDLLLALETLGFAGRRELALWIRLWLHRVANLARPLATQLVQPWQAVDVQKLFAAIKAGNTNTYGVLEQRFLDVACLHRCPAANGWRARGVGDSVNTTNISSRKLGDVDFQNPSSCRVEAFEAHAGKLTNVYVDEHLRTLDKSLVGRLQELEGIADAARWSIHLNFVAHELQVGLIAPKYLHGITVTMSTITFADLADSIAAPDLTALMNLHMRARLNEARTPESVRTKVRSILM